MDTPTASALPDRRVCDRARLSRDARFDGLFFTAVTSTGIYCRPVCPATPPKPSNVRYYASPAAAETAGYRPCLRCRPELAPGERRWHRGEHVVSRALRLIDQGLLDEASMPSLAARVGVSPRQLRRLFVERLGAAPLAVQATRRLLFARQLLASTRMPVTDVAHAAGFRSLRRFNDAFVRAHRMPPRALRRQAGEAPAGEALELTLAYRPPYDFAAVLGFLRGRHLPGVEAVDADSYRRLFGSADAPGWLRVSADPKDRHALRLQLHGARPEQLQGLVATLRRMFDLDADPRAIATALSASPQLAPMLARHPGQRLPGGWDGFEVAVRAVLGQQVSVAAARTLATRIAQRHGTPVSVPGPPGLERLFPGPATLANVDLRELGVVGARADTIRGIARALLDRRIDFRVEQSLEEFVARWVALPGIGDWTAHYMAMRALGHPDAFPAADLILRRAAAAGGDPWPTRALLALAEAWRPWRAYAVMHLWRSTADVASVPASKKRVR